MTPAVNQLKKLKIAHQLHQYHHDPQCQSFGQEAVEMLGVIAEIVFKTLVVNVDDSYLAVAIVPVENKLSLKKLAKALSAKKVKMADTHRVEIVTGYVLGGVSPFGQKKSLKTVIDVSAKALSMIYVSGGKRGLEIELATTDAIKVLKAQLFDIST
jgi:Cys-tRNA(Pro)/Cys-tRNA(Cys) deacylase